MEGLWLKILKRFALLLFGLLAALALIGIFTSENWYSLPLLALMIGPHYLLLILVAFDIIKKASLQDVMKTYGGAGQVFMHCLPSLAFAIGAQQLVMYLARGIVAKP